MRPIKDPPSLRLNSTVHRGDSARASQDLPAPVYEPLYELPVAPPLSFVPIRL